MLDLKKYLSVLVFGVLMFMTSCMEFSSSEAEAIDLSPLLDKQALFEKKLNQIEKWGI